MCVFWVGECACVSCVCACVCVCVFVGVGMYVCMCACVHNDVCVTLDSYRLLARCQGE